MQEIAELFHIHVNSVRQWIKQGLKLIDNQKPYLVHGSNLIAFLKAKQSERKAKCKKNQLYCCRCRSPRELANNAASLVIHNHKQLVISGNCLHCNTKVFRFGSVKSIPELKTIFHIRQTYDRRLIDTHSPIVNVDINKD